MSEAPPSYAQATGSSTKSSRPSNLQVPSEKNGIPAQHRRSMEDEQRPLPEGFVRQFDPKENHQFFVDVRDKANPRSMWHHPYDDEEYLQSLSSEERERIQEEERARRDDTSTYGDEKATPTSPGATSSSAYPSDLPARPSVSESSAGKKKFGTKLKDKLTGTTHEERQKERARRDEEEREYYEAHRRFRQAMQQAQITGQPQFFAKDRDGKEIYIEPPNTGYGGGYGGGGYGPYGAGGGYNGGRGFSPYNSGVYQNPNARFIRPSYPYNRPYGSYGGAYGGGGYGLPIAGGLLGGLLLGGLLF